MLRLILNTILTIGELFVLNALGLITLNPGAQTSIWMIVILAVVLSVAFLLIWLLYVVLITAAVLYAKESRSAFSICVLILVILLFPILFVGGGAIALYMTAQILPASLSLTGGFWLTILAGAIVGILRFPHGSFSRSK